MDSIFNWLKLATPFLELAYAAALLADPQIAGEVRKIIDAIERLANAPVDPNAPPSAARGLAAITVYVNNTLAALDALKANTTLTPEEKTKQASDLVANLSDPTKVWQAQRGQDAAVLAKGKTDAAAKAAAVNN